MQSDKSPASVEDFRNQLIAISDTLPKRLRQCADYLALNADKIAVSTVAELAQGAGVQPSALMRLCQLMGFSGFSDLQKIFRQDYNQRWPNYAARLDALRSTSTDNPADLLADFIATGQASLESLKETVDAASLQNAVNILVDAPTIHVIGLKRAFPVAYYLTYAFGKMSTPCMLHDRVGDLDGQHLIRPGDALIAISYAPYTQTTLDMAARSASRGIKVIAITDALNSPLQRTGTATLLVREVDLGDFRALSASFALAITLVTAVGARRG